MQKIDRASFLKELESVSEGLSSKNIIEQSNSFIFKDGKVYTYNDEIAAQTDVSITETEGVVDSEPLLKLLRKMRDEEIQVGTKDSMLLIKGKQSKTEIALSQKIKLPIEDTNKNQEFIEVSDDFSQLSKLACLTASKALNDEILTCVHYHNNVVESCDNDRITICKIPSMKKKLPNILVSARNLLRIVQDPIDAISYDDSWMYFRIKETNTVLSCRLFNEEYVDLQSLVPENKGTKLNLNEEILEVLDKADIFSTEQYSKDKNAHVFVKNKKLTVVTENDMGRHTEWLEINADNDISFNVNPDFLRDVLKLSDVVYITDDVLVFEDDNSTHLIQLEIDND